MLCVALVPRSSISRTTIGRPCGKSDCVVSFLPHLVALAAFGNLFSVRSLGASLLSESCIKADAVRKARVSRGRRGRFPRQHLTRKAKRFFTTAVWFICSDI